MSFPVIFIDYGNSRAEANWRTVQQLTPISQRVSAVGTLEQSVKQALQLGMTRCWIVSSHCDYTDFDFNFVPSKYDMGYVHVWSSAQTTFGETFLFANPNPWDPWDRLVDLPLKFISRGPDCLWDQVTWYRTEGNTYISDLCRAIDQQTSRLLFVHEGSTAEFKFDSISLDYEPKLVHLETENCFTYLAEASWLKEQDLLGMDFDSLEDQIVVDGALRTPDAIPVIYNKGSDVLRWINMSVDGHKEWVIVTHESVTGIDQQTVWNTIHHYANEGALHSWGDMVFAVNADIWRLMRDSFTSIYDHPMIITHDAMGRQDTSQAVFVRVKDFVNTFTWTPSNWDDMRGPVALKRGDVLLGIAGDEVLIKELELLDEDPWQWPDLRIVEPDAKILKRKLFNVKR